MGKQEEWASLLAHRLRFSPPETTRPGEIHSPGPLLIRLSPATGDPVKASSTTNGNGRTGPTVEQLTQQNVAKVAQLEEAARQHRTTTDCIAEAIANFCGSMRFVWVHVAWFGGWILVNTIPGLPHFDQFPFTFLTLVVSLEAIFLSTFILISQNLETRLTDRRSHLDLQLNLLSEQENTKMIAILLAIAKKVDADLSHDPKLEALTEETRPERLVEQIEAREEKQ